MNRLTITLDDDLYAMARAYAVTQKLSLSKAISQLLRRSASTASRPPSPFPEPSEEDPDVSFRVDPRSGLPVVKGKGIPITNEDVQRGIDDDDIRHLEMMGLSPEEIERSLNS